MKRAERQQLADAIAELQARCADAAEIRFLQAHLPLSGVVALDGPAESILCLLRAESTARDIADASRLASTSWFDGRKSLAGSRDAAARLLALREELHGVGLGHLPGLRQSLERRLLDERVWAGSVLARLSAVRSSADQLLFDAAHLPFAHLGSVPGSAMTAARSMVALVDDHEPAARLVAQGISCQAGECAEGHRSARLLGEVHNEASTSGAFELIDTWMRWAAAERASQLASLPATVSELAELVARATQTLDAVEHLAFTRSGVLSGGEVELLGRVRSMAGHLEVARPFSWRPPCGAHECAAMHASIAAVGGAHAQLATGGAQQVFDLLDRVTRLSDGERSRLDVVLRQVELWRAAAARALHNDDHRLLAVESVLTDWERRTARTTRSVVDQHLAGARSLVDSPTCAAGTCADVHPSAVALGRLHRELDQEAAGAGLLAAARRAHDGLQQERERLVTVVSDVAAWQATGEEARRSERHVPVSGPAVLSTAERSALADLDEVAATHLAPSRLALDPATCGGGVCADLHPSARVLHSFATFAQRGAALDGAATRLGDQVEAERAALGAVVAEVEEWHAAAVRARQCVEHMPISGDGMLSDDEEAALTELEEAVTAHLVSSRRVVDPLTCASESCDDLHPAARLLASFHRAFSERRASVVDVA